MSTIPLRTISKCHTIATVYEQRNLGELSEEGGITDQRVLTISCELTQAPHTHTPSESCQQFLTRVCRGVSIMQPLPLCLQGSCPVILDQHGVVLDLRLFLLSEAIRYSLC